MNEEQALIEGITRDCHDRLAVKVYADWLQEHRGLSRFGALRESTRHRLPLLRQYEFTAVEEMLKEDNPFQIVCLRIIWEALPEGFTTNVTLRVRHDIGPPFSSDGVRLMPALPPVGAWVNVSARWLLRRLDTSALIKDRDGNVSFLDEYDDQEHGYEDVG